MVSRVKWKTSIEDAWEHRSIIWLAGVRRVGKTCLCQSLDDVEYFDCELPRVRRELEQPEDFLRSVEGKRLVIDEVHRLPNPSELLKIAADHYPKTRIIATGSSTLQASTKFRDTLTGRKSELLLTPMAFTDLADFDNTDIRHRLLRGGLPPFFLSAELPERDFQEWVDSYWAKDVQELFRLERRASFQRLLELLFVNSGGIFEATKYAGPCEVSRTTIVNYMHALEATWVAHVVRPFSTHHSTEIVSAPKVYGFDTGFVSFYKGWQQLRTGDLGSLWEHFVLNELQAAPDSPTVRYWRDKRGHEVDFVLINKRRPPLTLECKWSADNLDTRNIKAFRGRYPDGDNWVVAHDVERSFQRTMHGISIRFIGINELGPLLKKLLEPLPE